MRALGSLLRTTSVFTGTLSYLNKSKHTKDITELKQAWAREILARLNVEVEVVGEASDVASLVLVGNHISYLDIPVLFYAAKDVSFVAKAELKKWPIFGRAAKKVNTVFVKRESGSSRLSARSAILSALSKGARVVVFPSGTTCTHESKPWRRGAFEIAQKSKSMVQPFRISYEPLRAVAYIDQDFFPTHLFGLVKLPQIKARIEFHAPVMVEDYEKSCAHWYEWSRGGPQ